MKQPKSRVLDALVRFRKLEERADRQNLARAADNREEAETVRREAEARSREALSDRGQLGAAGQLIDVSRYANALHHGGEVHARLEHAEQALQQAAAEHQSALDTTTQSRKKLDVTTKRAQAHAEELERDREAASRWDSLDRWLAQEDRDV